MDWPRYRYRDCQYQDATAHPPHRGSFVTGDPGIRLLRLAQGSAAATARPGPQPPQLGLGRSRGLRCHYVGHDAGDVVGTAAVDGQRDEILRGLVRIADGEQDPRDGPGGHDRVQAIGGQQVPVAGQSLVQLEVRLEAVVRGEHPQQQHPLRVRRYLPGRDLALIQQRLHHRMVMGYLEHLAVTGVPVAERSKAELAVRVLRPSLPVKIAISDLLPIRGDCQPDRGGVRLGVVLMDLLMPGWTASPPPARSGPAGRRRGRS